MTSFPLTNNPARADLGHPEAGQVSWARHAIVLWLVGTLVLLPVQFTSLPLNMDPVDVWMLAGLLVFWLSFALGCRTIRANLTYAVAMLIILIGSLLSTFAAPNVRGCIVVVLKEVYLFVWLVTLIDLLSRLRPKDFRLVMSVWVGTVVLHGTLIVGQFFSPELWRFTASLASKSTEYEFFRPSGLFVNANSAACFQLLGFVPLVLANPSKRTGTVLAIALATSMLATGSMGTTLAFVTGLVVALIAIAALGHLEVILNLFMRSMIAVVVFGGLMIFVISQDRGYQVHIERILLGRAERSSGGRFALWQRGLDEVIESDSFLWKGTGPENFREVDVLGKQLHNDLVAFTVERGLLGVLGLVLFAAIAMSRALAMLSINSARLQCNVLQRVVFPAAIVAILVASLTHQVFHYRDVWLVLAVQEALLFRTAN